MYLQVTLLDEKGGLPVIFRSKRPKDNGRGGKFMQRVDIHHHDHQLFVLTQYSSGMHVSQTWSSVPELNVNA